jgi:hypothetical protein
MYYRLIHSIDLYIHVHVHFSFKVFKAIYIALQKKSRFTIFGLKSDHVRISIRSIRYLGLTSVVFTTRTGGIQV